MNKYVNFYLLSLTNAEASQGTPLSTKGQTLHEVSKDRSWQIQGGFDTRTYVKSTRVGRDTYKCTNTGKLYKSCIGAYTESAYQELLDDWNT